MAEGASPRPPYPGLAAYGAADAALFFGRAAERDLIVANLRAARVTVLYGPGGVGKSSLLHAGVVHRLREMSRPKRALRTNPKRPRTDVVILDDWGGDPAARLAAAIRALPYDGAEPPPDDDAVPGGAGGGGAGTALSRAETARRAAHGGALLIVLDQFEEYLRLHPDPQHGFDAALAELVGDPGTAVHILIAIREDRLADLDRFAGRVPQLLGNLLRLGPMSPEAALAAIEKPIEHYAAATGRKVSLEPGLATTVLEQLVASNQRRRAQLAPAGGAHGAPGLPSVDTSHLQLVMRELWDADIEAAGGTQITQARLTKLGGVDRIIATHLDRALDGLARDEQALTAEMLRFLVTPSGATACLTALDLAKYTDRREADIESLAEKLSRPPARILRGVTESDGATRRGGYELSPVLAEPAAEWALRRRTLGLERRTRRLMLGLASVIAIAIALTGYTLAPDRLQRLELASVDARFALRGATGDDSRVAVVTRGSAPHNPRARMARALAAIATAGPLAVALNIEYPGSANPEKNDHPAAADNALRAALTGPLSDRLVIVTATAAATVTSGVTTAGATVLGPHGPTLRDEQTHPLIAWDGLPLDRDRVVRRITPAVTLVPKEESGGAPALQLDRLAVVAARLAGEPPPKRTHAWIDFRGAPGTFSQIALDDVVAQRPAALAKLRGKVVLVGYTEPMFNTAAPGASQMNATELQANAISTALDGFPLHSGARGVDIALIVLLGLLPLGVALALRRRPALVAAAGIVVAAIFCAAAQLAFAGGWVIAVVMPLASLALATIAVAVLDWRLVKAAARRTRTTAGETPASPEPRGASPERPGATAMPSSA